MSCISCWLVLRGDRELGPFMGVILLFFLQAVKLTSSRTQLPYEYYSLPFCQPTKITYKAENLGMCLLNSALPAVSGLPFMSCVRVFTGLKAIANVISNKLSVGSLLPLIHAVLAVCKLGFRCSGKGQCLSSWRACNLLHK